MGIPPMEDFHLGGASVQLFLPIFKMSFPDIVDVALPTEGVFHNLVFMSIHKTYPIQAYKIMHGLWGMWQMIFTKYIVVVDDDVDVYNTSEVLFRLRANTDPRRDSIFTKGPADVLDHDVNSQLSTMNPQLPCGVKRRRNYRMRAGPLAQEITLPTCQAA
jgi:4-hydroxy-3-polyprenylbenzoate decarboxylase